MALTDMDPTVKLWLGILGGTAQAVWGFADVVGDMQTFQGEDGERGGQSGVIDMFDMWCPLFETFFLYPCTPPIRHDPESVRNNFGFAPRRQLSECS
jgi:hypothetical protein